MQHWYVYYKLPRERFGETAAQVRAMIDLLGTSAAVKGRLLKRDDGDQQSITLMEQYDSIADPGAFAAELAAALRSSGLPAELIALRRVERFEDV
ncbi:MAG: DUF4936 family protein [Gemmatimonadota bacterium]